MGAESGNVVCGIELAVVDDGIGREKLKVKLKVKN